MRYTIEFGFQIRKIRPALTRTLGITSLRHKAIDHTMKDHPVIETLLCQRLDSLDVIGSPGRDQPDGNAPAS